MLETFKAYRKQIVKWHKNPLGGKGQLLRAEGLAFTIVYMLYEASCNKQFIPIEELGEVLDEHEMSTLIKMLRDIRIIVSRKEYIDAINYVRSVLDLPKDDNSILIPDSLSDDGIVALNPAIVDEMRKTNGIGDLSYHMVRSFISELLGQLELTATMGSLNELVRDLAQRYDDKFKVAVAKDIIINYSCNLSDAEKVSLAAAKLVSPSKYDGVISIMLSRARKLAERISLELTEEDVEAYVIYGANRTGMVGTEARAGYLH